MGLTLQPGPPPEKPGTPSRLREAEPCLALTRLEAALGLVDHVDPALAAHEPVVPVPATQRFQRIADLHGSDPWLRARRLSHCVVRGTYGSGAGVSTSGETRIVALRPLAARGDFADRIGWATAPRGASAITRQGRKRDVTPPDDSGSHAPAGTGQRVCASVAGQAADQGRHSVQRRQRDRRGAARDPGAGRQADRPDLRGREQGRRGRHARRARRRQGRPRRVHAPGSLHHARGRARDLSESRL